jgi:hypothetical protein
MPLHSVLCHICYQSLFLCQTLKIHKEKLENNTEIKGSK